MNKICVSQPFLTFILVAWCLNCVFISIISVLLPLIYHQHVQKRENPGLHLHCDDVGSTYCFRFSHFWPVIPLLPLPALHLRLIILWSVQLQPCQTPARLTSLARSGSPAQPTNLHAFGSRSAAVSSWLGRRLSRPILSGWEPSSGSDLGPFSTI